MRAAISGERRPWCKPMIWLVSAKLDGYVTADAVWASDPTDDDVHALSTFGADRSARQARSAGSRRVHEVDPDPPLGQRVGDGSH